MASPGEPIGAMSSQEPDSIPMTDDPPPHSEATSPSRVAVFAWAFLTWAFTFAFFVLLMVVFTQTVSLGEGRTEYKRSQTIVSKFGCMRRASWAGWGTVMDMYMDPSAKVAGVANPPAFTSTEANAILAAALEEMRCYGSPSSTATDIAMFASFGHASGACQCVHKAHVDLFGGQYAAIAAETDPAARLLDLSVLATNFTTDGGGRSILRDCFMGRRSTHHLEFRDGCTVSMSPFATVLFANTVACIMGSLYVLRGESKGSTTSSAGGAWNTFLAAITHAYFVVGTICVATALAIVGFILSYDSFGMAVVPTIVAAVVGGIAVAVVLYIHGGAGTMTLTGRAEKAQKAVASALKYVDENRVVMQRMLFWLQYLVTLPLLVMLHDSMAQQKVESYLLGRAIFAVGLGVLAFSGDALTMLAENAPSPHARCLMEAAWWAWLCWILGAGMLLYSSGPIALPWGLVDLIPGGSTLVPAAFALYVVAMPIASIPGVAGALNPGGQVNTTSLALRLWVDFAARALLTMAVYMWLFMPEYP